VSTLIPTVIDEIARDLYIAAINREYGAVGITILKEVMATLRDLFRYVEPEALTHPLILCKAFNADEPILAESPTVTALSPNAIANEITGPCVIQIRANGDLLVWKNTQVDLATISQIAIVYLYSSRQEFFVIKGDHRRIPNPSPTHASIFAIPTFRILREALLDYRNRMVRTSRCKIFSEVWRDDNRVLLKSKPEAAMRDSLAQFLTSVLGGDVEARPEQNVDESHPVDVKVTWLFTNRHAIIEVKWLGKSIGTSGETTVYSDARARDGAGQLADYLDKDKVQAAQKVSRGYLVVIDARRRGVTEASTSINEADGMYYEHREIEFDPNYHQLRNDFEEPIRMFAEPICQ
jgi:hypothetical protein